MPTPTTFEELVRGLLGLINIIIPTILGFIFLFLVWKIIDSWIINAGDESKREEGKQYAMVSTIVMVLMLILWGLVAMLRRSVFGF
jgi:uncharacterized membrane-anchored protein